jgi:hypothetical protein
VATEMTHGALMRKRKVRRSFSIDATISPDRRLLSRLSGTSSEIGPAEASRHYSFGVTAVTGVP